MLVGTTGDREKPVRSARKALEYPLDPIRKSRVYMYLGTALSLSQGPVRGEEMRPIRREAAKAYLAAIETAVSVPPLPDTKLAGTQTDIVQGGLMPLPPKFDLPPSIAARWLRDPEPARTYREVGVDSEPPVALVRPATPPIRLSDIDHQWDAAKRSLVYMYAKAPYDTQELRDMATETLHDKELVAALVSAVEEGIQHAWRQMPTPNGADLASSRQSRRMRLPHSHRPCH